MLLLQINVPLLRIGVSVLCSDWPNMQMYTHVLLTTLHRLPQK